MAEYWYDEAYHGLGLAIPQGFFAVHIGALKIGIQMQGPSYANLVMAAELLGDSAAVEKWFRMACQRQAAVQESFIEKLLQRAPELGWSILMDRQDLSGARAWLQRAKEDVATGERLGCSTFPTRIVISDTEHRAISMDQLSRIWAFIKQHCRRWHDFFKISPTRGQPLTAEIINLYHLDAWLIRPATQAENCSMVELMASKAQTPQWFISHWWGEPVHAFTTCVKRHAEIRQLPGTSCYWVCAYANRQHALSQEVAADPRETSFFRALNLSEGVLLILDEATESSGPATPFTRIWCAFEEFVALTPGARLGCCWTSRRRRRGRRSC
ncbi:unnamed protein product [Cladocopium goreaui]|uniref:Uncharacterized protein n=1 Tax=Cladocopium goreaui TaxID=2562237 RepID=A0A9P1DCA2_9DINO|nr:unnamed protein product [Cladocopium goreaui]